MVSSVIGFINRFHWDKCEGLMNSFLAFSLMSSVCYENISGYELVLFYSENLEHGLDDCDWEILGKYLDWMENYSSAHSCF